MESAATQVVDKRALTKFTSLVFLDLFVGLAVTAISCFGFSYWFSKLIGSDGDYTGLLFGVLIGGFVILLISQVVLTMTLFKAKKGAWIPYLLYAATMGLMLAPVVMFKVSIGTIAEAFGITALVFLVMFCIGYFTKSSLGSLGFIGIGLLISVMLSSITFGIIYLINPYAGLLLDYVVSLVCVIAVMLIVGWDANRMQREVGSGAYVTSSTALYYAYVFYTDFIAIFIRILYLLALAKRNN